VRAGKLAMDRGKKMCASRQKFLSPELDRGKNYSPAAGYGIRKEKEKDGNTSASSQLAS